ncbi:MAG: DUF1858 domain-containing protein [Planctomycetia bacterium]|nr:DUF1858 domain-containing protein [Planctomycetia bacterium]MCC7315475.1 DUF1858 domain-containing protein [Planctomycetota bacterium]OQZ05173.1 MAG: hypothetical protein B6D36_11475 [Planctomycetes bacterium UTPLA1]
MTRPPASAGLILPDMMLPDVLRRHPGVRVVFDKYGLRGCGGPHGPAESVAYFARAHGVPEVQLIDELNDAAAHPSTAPQAPAPDLLAELANTIYRRFFKAGMVVVLTAGAVWGAVLLLRIGWNQAFTSISIHDINAHGHAQIFGWVGLFVMGFAYQAFPRIKHTNLWRPDLANMSFYLMVFGVFARAIGEPLFARPMFRELAVAASFAEIAAIGIFVTVLLQTFRLSGKPYERHDAFVVASLGFFFIQAVYDLGLLYATTSAIDRTELLRIISTYQAPLRDLQIHGFAMLMILGVGIRMFPALFGMASPGRKLVTRSLVLLVTAIIAEAGIFIVMRRTGDYRWAVPLYAAMTILAGTSIVLTLRWGLLARPTERDRSTKFVRCAVAWLHTSMIMLVLAPLYLRVILPAAGALSVSGQESLQIGFSHAYYGAVRHAITVGFISLMIMGMAAKVVPTLNGVDIRRLRPLWLPFILVNTGCAMRVTFQIATDFAEWAYPIAGVSGLFEVAGIAVWGVSLWRIMNGWNPAAEPVERPTAITADDKIGLVIEWFPATLPVLLAKGFAPLANPIMRRTMARAISVRTAAAHQQLNLEQLLAELNDAAFGRQDEAREPEPMNVSLKVLNHV